MSETYYNVKRIPFSTAGGAGVDRLIVAAVPGRKIRGLAVSWNSDAAMTYVWKSNATAISGPFFVQFVGIPITLPRCEEGWFETGLGEALNLNCSTANALGGILVYAEILP